jgi:hypothetical protein
MQLHVSLKPKRRFPGTAGTKPGKRTCPEHKTQAYVCAFRKMPFNKAAMAMFHVPLFTGSKEKGRPHKQAAALLIF